MVPIWAQLGTTRPSPVPVLAAQMAKFTGKLMQGGLRDCGGNGIQLRACSTVGRMPSSISSESSSSRGKGDFTDPMRQRTSNLWHESNTSKMGVVYMCQDRVCAIDTLAWIFWCCVVPGQAPHSRSECPNIILKKRSDTANHPHTTTHCLTWEFYQRDHGVGHLKYWNHLGGSFWSHQGHKSMYIYIYRWYQNTI